MYTHTYTHTHTHMFDPSAHRHSPSTLASSARRAYALSIDTYSHMSRQTSTLPLMLTSARPPTRAWEVARTVVAPPLSVVKLVGGVRLGVLSCACVCRCRGCFLCRCVLCACDLLIVLHMYTYLFI